MPIYKTDKKKDGKYLYRVRVSYVDSFGKKRQKERHVYGLAESRMAELELQNDIVVDTPTNASISVNSLYIDYMKTKKSEVRITTYEKSKRILEGNILPTLGRLKLSNLTSFALNQWKLEITARDISIRTKQNIYAELRAMLNFAVKMEYLQKNPLSSVGNFKDIYWESECESIQFYTADEFRLFISALKEDCTSITDYGFYIFFLIAFFTGLRKGEINALKWSDLSDDFICVNRSVSQKVKGLFYEGPPKNKSSRRTVQIPLLLVNELNEHKHRQMADNRFSSDFRICGGIKCLGDTSISNKNKLYAKKCNLNQIRIHDFRHSHASLLVNEGINIQEVSRRLGHSKIEITWNRYSHMYPRENERAIALLDSINL